MKSKICLIFCCVAFASCQPSADEKAAEMMKKIDSLYARHDYKMTLRTIRELRVKHPHAIESRKRALEVWQEASVRQAQQDIGTTDSALQATTLQWHNARTIADKNRLKVKVDSLQIRYDALCGTVRVIRKRQAQKSI